MQALAYTDLERRFDGPIPRDLRLAAIAADYRALRAVPAMFHVKLRLKRWKPGGLVRALAEAMVHHRRIHGVCVRKDLLDDGFNIFEINAHHSASRALADRLWRKGL